MLLYSICYLVHLGVTCRYSDQNLNFWVKFCIKVEGLFSRSPSFLGDQLGWMKNINEKSRIWNQYVHTFWSNRQFCKGWASEPPPSPPIGDRVNINQLDLKQLYYSRDWNDFDVKFISTDLNLLTGQCKQNYHLTLINQMSDGPVQKKRALSLLV